MRTAALCTIVFALFLFSASHACAASLIGQKCKGFGTTTLDTDQTKVIACLCPEGTDGTVPGSCDKTGIGSNATRWKGMSYEVPSTACADSDSVLRYSNGVFSCAKAQVYFRRFPTGEMVTGEQVCQRYDATSHCVSQGNGVNNYLFCDTAQQDDTGASAGVHCLRFVAP